MHPAAGKPEHQKRRGPTDPRLKKGSLSYRLRSFPRNKLILLFLPIPIPARVFVVIYAVVELAFGVSGADSGVAHFAHLGGLVGGALMLFYWRGFRFARS